MVLQYGLQLRCFIRFARGLGLKGCDFVSGIWSRCDFDDLWGSKLLPLMNTVWKLCKLLILELLICPVGCASIPGFSRHGSQNFHDGDRSLDDSSEDGSGLIRFGLWLRSLIRFICCLIRSVCGLIRFICGLVEKECDLIIGLCSELDFGDVKGSKLLYFVSSVCVFCKISVLQPLIAQVCDAASDNFGEDGSKVFYDCDGDDGEWYYGDSMEDGSGLFHDCQDQVADFNNVMCENDTELYLDCDDSDGGLGCVDGMPDVMALRDLLNAERQRADTAVVELEKERLANSSAAEEAMTMILRLQSEKSLIEIEAHNYKKMAEQRMLYDEDTIKSLQMLLLQHESEQVLLEEQLRVCRQKLKLYSHKPDKEQSEGLDITFSNSILKNGCEMDYHRPE